MAVSDRPVVFSHIFVMRKRNRERETERRMRYIDRDRWIETHTYTHRQRERGGGRERGSWGRPICFNNCDRLSVLAI